MVLHHYFAWLLLVYLFFGITIGWLGSFLAERHHIVGRYISCIQFDWDSNLVAC